jgi:hypothetical protein
MSKTFKPIPGPFGHIDEAATTQAFEEFMGGVSRAQQILRVWNNSYPSYRREKIQNFISAAGREGFKSEEISAFLSL